MHTHTHTYTLNLNGSVVLPNLLYHQFLNHIGKPFMLLHQHCGLTHAHKNTHTQQHKVITWSEVEERLQPCYNFNYHKTPLSSSLVSPPSVFPRLCLFKCSLPLVLFVIPLTPHCDQQKSIILFVFLLHSPLYPSLPFSPSFILSFSYHIIDHLKSIHFVSNSPLSSPFCLSLSALAGSLFKGT